MTTSKSTCPYCGHSLSLTDLIVTLHKQGLNPRQIKEELISNGVVDKSWNVIGVYTRLYRKNINPHKTPRMGRIRLPIYRGNK